MKVVAIGKVSAHGAQNRAERGKLALENAERLGLKLEFLYYTSGPYDFVEVLDAPNWEAAYAQALWFRKAGYGELILMPCVDPETNAKIDAQAG